MNRTHRRRMKRGSQAHQEKPDPYPYGLTLYPDTGAPYPPPDMEALEAACSDDRLWFLAHPQARRRLRHPVIGEFHQAPDEPELAGVLVEQLQPGVRCRKGLRHFGKGSFILGPDGEVLSMEYELQTFIPYGMSN